eukprot:2606409-Rhodomonas_salina.2
MVLLKRSTQSSCGTHPATVKTNSDPNGDNSEPDDVNTTTSEPDDVTTMHERAPPIALVRARLWQRVHCVQVCFVLQTDGKNTQLWSKLHWLARLHLGSQTRSGQVRGSAGGAYLELGPGQDDRQVLAVLHTHTHTQYLLSPNRHHACLSRGLAAK